MAFDVDRAKAEITLEEAASRCGIDLPVHGGPPNVRIDCPFDCPGDHAGKRELSVNVVNNDKIFRCHNYECQFRGNLIHLMHGWLTGQRPAEGRVRGEDFKRVKAVLLGETTVAPAKAADSAVNATAGRTAEVEATAPKRNVPLINSDNAKARELVGMEEVFTADPAKMTPKCSAYWRERRHYLTDELCETWGVGVRPSRAGVDKRGWSLRNHVVYRFLSEDNKVLCYVGRDPEYDEKLRAFEAIPAEQRDPKKRPMKHKFPIGFHRGIELYGQQSDRLTEHPQYREFISQHGIIVVEGFNDVLALDHLGVPAVAICSNRMTQQQATKVARWARAFTLPDSSRLEPHRKTAAAMPITDPMSGTSDLAGAQSLMQRLLPPRSLAGAPAGSGVPQTGLPPEPPKAPATPDSPGHAEPHIIDRQGGLAPSRKGRWGLGQSA